jgi:hypothetical protein
MSIPDHEPPRCQSRKRAREIGRSRPIARCKAVDHPRPVRVRLQSPQAPQPCVGQHATTEFVYVPGNHDYIIWNLLSTQTAFMEPLERGDTLGKGPLMAQYYPAPFVRGVAPPSHRNRFHVDYPDHVIDVNGKKTGSASGRLIPSGPATQPRTSCDRGMRLACSPDPWYCFGR